MGKLKKAEQTITTTVTAPLPTGNPLATYLTLACTSTGQSTFYNTRDEQETALATAHQALLTTDRRIYSLTAALPLNDRSRQLICLNLLQHGKTCQDTPLEAAVLTMITDDMQFNRVLNMMVELRRKKTNCARVRRLGRALWTTVDEFRAIKYTSKLRTILRHCHIPDGATQDPARGELWHYVTGNLTTADEIHHNPKLKARFLARTNYDSLFALPLDIARDLAVAFHGKKPDEFEKEFVGASGVGGAKGKGATTRKETMIVRSKAAKTETKATTDIDFGRFTLTELLAHGYRNPSEQATLTSYIGNKAFDLGRSLALPHKVAIVIDNSLSMRGSKERLYWPLITVSSIISVFRHSGSDVTEYYTGTPPAQLDTGPSYFLQAGGDTCLRSPLVEALLTRPNILVLLSDGYENVTAGSVSQILNSQAVKDSGIRIIHMNPVAATEAKTQIRSLAPNLNAYALASIEQMGAIAMLALASQDSHALDGMFLQIEELLRAGDYRQAKAIGNKLHLPAIA